MGDFTAPPEPGGFSAPAAPATVPATRPCPNCSREFGPGNVCQSCGQVEGLPIGFHVSTVGRRIWAAILDGLLAILTLIIGWIIWAIVVAGKGQSPAKKILGLRVVKITTGKPATRGTMFGRYLLKRLINVFGVIGLVLDFWMTWDKNRQELWDK